MEASRVQKIAHALNILVTATFLCNLIALPLVPGAVYFRFSRDGVFQVSRRPLPTIQMTDWEISLPFIFERYGKSLIPWL